MSVESAYVESLGSELDKHRDKWIVVVGKEIVYSGHNPKEGRDKAMEKYPGSIPFIIKILKEKSMLL